MIITCVCRTYLRDLVEATHLFMKMLERHCSKHSHLVVQRKKKKVRRRAQPKKKDSQSSNTFYLQSSDYFAPDWGAKYRDACCPVWAPGNPPFFPYSFTSPFPHLLLYLLVSFTFYFFLSYWLHIFFAFPSLPILLEYSHSISRLDVIEGD